MSAKVQAATGGVRLRSKAAAETADAARDRA
eukprot:CAMPEP_0206050774 /NCGR_PEP_ID=MMETSP1466-20131121/29954_1 /ASSEMBLY_ACC=CAM_ASM_001126 /TAXON_ID=44452 /ORGANISM="Pavlova gyrans, Strain CCMP608" /LENGTH=30 /DNA_ID= /DNA_START= /DNA_END= /DNA_ORIENTATION=